MPFPLQDNAVGENRADARQDGKQLTVGAVYGHRLEEERPHPVREGVVGCRMATRQPVQAFVPVMTTQPGEAYGFGCHGRVEGAAMAELYEVKHGDHKTDHKQN